MTIYGKRIVEALQDGPLTLAELVEATRFSVRYVLQGLGDARAAGRRVFAVARPGEPTVYELRGEE